MKLLLDTQPYLPYHHNDPFDRLMIAQAMQEEMVLLTKDQAFRDYDVQVMWTSPL